MKFEVVIPARGGSKRLANKNILMLGSMPLICHSITYAKNSGFKTVWVNTENSQIAAVAANSGAKITIRPVELAGDLIPTAEVIKFQIEEWNKINLKVDVVILLQATNPFRPQNLIINAIRLFKKSGRNSLACFSTMKKKFGYIEKNYFHPENYKPGDRFQDLKPKYFENGLLYITKVESIMRGEIITDDCYPMIIDSIHGSVDIDDNNDLLFAKYLIENNIIPE
jgi:CMP-N-acetylneuraminic acid synthetase